MISNSRVILFSHPPKTRRLISLTPLIDVVFILLVFFMLASNYQKWYSLPLNSVQKGNGQSKPQVILVRLKPDTLDINGKSVNLHQLNEFIKNKLIVMPNLRVLIQSSDTITIQRLVDVIDEINSAGCQNISIMQP